MMISFNSNAQNVTITGKAHASHIEKEIVSSSFADYLTYTKIKESADTTYKSGYFEFNIQTKTTKPFFIYINKS